METQPCKSNQATAGGQQSEACEAPSLFKCLLLLPPFFCSLRKNKTRGRANSLLCCDCSPEKQQAAVGLLRQVPEDERFAAFLSIGAQGEHSFLDSGTTFPGPREGDLGWSLEDTYHIWCRRSDCNGFCSWHSSTAALLSRMRASSLWVSSGKVITAWLGSWTPWATILDQNSKGPCVL